MRAFIKQDRWVNFLATSMSYGFSSDTKPHSNESMLVRPVDNKEFLPIFLIITMDKELHLITPMGESPFMETQEHTFKDLVDDGLIEYVKGEFD